MIPPNIKEEIQKIPPVPLADRILAIKFYNLGIGDRDAIAKAAFEAGREGMFIDDAFEYDWMDGDRYLASDEYKKLVGE